LAWGYLYFKKLTSRTTIATINYMNILMDSDCLIKLTKAGLKEMMATLCKIAIPPAVQSEVVEAGKKKQCHDAFVVEKNISDNKISIFGNMAMEVKGDDAVIELFDKSIHDAVGTDDTRLAKRLQNNGIPFLLPAVIILKLRESGKIEQAKALWMLDQLAPFISDDEYAMVFIHMRSLS
jgi:rRNA-processing protein FCF1